MPHKPHEAEKAFHDLLDLFTEKGYPGVPSVRSQWISEERVAILRNSIPRPTRRLYELVEDVPVAIAETNPALGLDALRTTFEMASEPRYGKKEL